MSVPDRPALRWLLRLSCAAVMAGALAYIPYRVYGSDGYARYRKLEDELTEVERGNAALRDENLTLRRDIHRLRHDLETIAQVARDELGLVGPGEIVVKIEPAP